MRSVKRVAERLKECSVESQRVFISLGYAILDAVTREEVESLFAAMCGETGLDEVCEFLPKAHQSYVAQHKPQWWTKSSKWAEW